MIQIETRGKRHYLTGNTYPFRDRIKSLGAHWDADSRSWWTGKREEAEQLVAQLNAAPAAAADSRESYDGEVRGKVAYKGKTYFVRWAGTTSRGTEAFRLVTLDGQIDFWADAAECKWLKRYERREERGFYGRPTGRAAYPTLASIRRFIAREKRESEKTGIDCWACRKYCTCGTATFCHHHHDGCDVCGEER